jgi:dUTP pyrophosphatase
MEDKFKNIVDSVFDKIDNNDTNENDVDLTFLINEFAAENEPMSFDSTPSPFKLSLDFVNKSNNPNPEYATEGSSGFDLRANLTESITIKTGERVLVPTGLYFDIPRNMEITIRSRSGLAYKHGIAVLNGIGTIDSDYTGEIGVLLINHGKNDFIIEHGDRIAQGVLTTVASKSVINLTQVDEIKSNTERSSGGYGSTGVK